MKTPEQLAAECAEKICKYFDQLHCKEPVVDILADAIAPLVGQIEELKREVEQAKADRNKAGVVERSKYLPQLVQQREAIRLCVKALNEAKLRAAIIIQQTNQPQTEPWHDSFKHRLNTVDAKCIIEVSTKAIATAEPFIK